MKFETWSTTIIYHCGDVSDTNSTCSMIIWVCVQISALQRPIGKEHDEN